MSRKWLAVGAKAAVSVLLIWYLFDRVDIRHVIGRARDLDLGYAILCVAALAVQTVLVTMRWWLVAQVTEAYLPWSTALRTLLIGLFFNQTLPSSVGGDAVRVWLLTRDGLAIGKAVNVVLCDRVVGLVVLVGIIGLSLPALNPYISDPAMRAGLNVVALAALAAFATFLLAGEKLAKLLRLWRFTRPFGHLATDFRQLFLRPRATAILIALSVVIHLLTVTAVTVLARGTAIPLSFFNCLLIVPTVMLVTTVPISIAGWGVRESAMVAGFGLIGMAPVDALALSVLYGLFQILISLPGGVVWLISRPRGRPEDLPAPTDA